MLRPPPKDSGQSDVNAISAEIAKQHAEFEFKKYRVKQDRLFESDFDKFMLGMDI